jgi:hypothetical protein
MIFQYSHEMVLDGTKTQTRRIVNDEESPIRVGDKIVGVRGARRVKWQVGLTYAAQPGRTKKAIGHIKVISIRQERLQDVSEADAQAEGFRSREDFHRIWSSIHTKHGRRWEDNPLVWVLEFELE